MATCGARTKTCRNCGHRYTKDEYDLWKCPECGEDRHCQRPVAYEGKRCSVHGGKSLAGVNHPKYKTGRHSKYLPDRLQARYEEARNDPELLAVRSEVALLDARLSELLERVDTGEGAAAWSRLRKIHDNLQSALEEQDVQALSDTIAAMESVIERGSGEDAVWAQIYDVVERVRLLKQTEHKRLTAMHQMITAERAYLMISRIHNIIIENVTDPEKRLAIASELRELSLSGSE